MFAYATDAHTNNVCESEWELEALELGGELLASTESYGIGMRTTNVTMPLAYARVWALNIGRVLAPPNGWSQSAWDAELDRLVQTRLGTYRCLNCGNFHNGSKTRCVAENTCPQCCGVSEEVGI